MSFWNKKSFCLITGASSGIGKEVAVQFAENVGKGSIFCLLARSKDGLEETKNLIEKKVGDKVKIKVYSIDLSKPNNEEYLKMISEAAGENLGEFDQNMLVHNAASQGIKDNALELNDLEDWQNYYTINVFSMVLLTSQFFKIFNNQAKDRMIIQISSGVSFFPLPKLSLYSSGKCARNNIIQVISAEDPSIKSMSYAPGCVEDTVMYQENLKTADESMKEILVKFKNEGRVLSCEQSVDKLVKILAENKFIKGEYVDYYQN